MKGYHAGNQSAQLQQAFLVDQPFSNLGVRIPVRKRTGNKSVHEWPGTATAFVAHGRIGAMTMSDAVALNDEGSIARLGNSPTFCDLPSNIFAAGFTGTPAKSLFEGRFDRVAGQFRAEWRDSVHQHWCQPGSVKIRIPMAGHGNNMQLSSNSSTGIPGSCLPRYGKMEPVPGVPGLDCVRELRPDYSAQESGQRKAAERFFPGGPQ